MSQHRIAEGVFIHPSAEVESPVEIGEGTRIWRFCHVMPYARIGRGCSLGQGCFVGKGVRMGDGVRVQNHVSLFSGVQLEDDVFCGPSVVFTNVKNPRARFPRDGYTNTLVKRGATIGANATIVCGLTLAEHSFIAAGAVVTHDVPAFALMVGVPAVRTGWMSPRGERLRFDLDGIARCSVSGSRFRLQGEVVSVVSEEA